MAQAKTMRFGDTFILLGGVLIGDAYVAPCGFTTIAMTVNVETSTTNIPDCSDPDLESWLAIDAVSKQMVLSGEGVMDTDAWAVWRAWMHAGGTRYGRWVRDLTGANGGGYFQGPMLLTGYDENGERGQRWQGNIEVTFDGKPTWTAAV